MWDMPTLELETPEAIFKNDMDGNCHFIIDCACGGKDGEYHGSHYKNGDGVLEEKTESYRSLRHSRSRHTFLLSELILFDELMLEHSEERGENPLVVVCNDCGREFPFT